MICLAHLNEFMDHSRNESMVVIAGKLISFVTSSWPGTAFDVSRIVPRDVESVVDKIWADDEVDEQGLLLLESKYENITLIS